MVDKICKNYQKMAMPVKAAMWFMICSVIPQVITVIMTTVFTRVLSTDDYGISSNYSAWYNIVSIFITLNLNCGVYNNAMLRYEKRRDEYTSSMMGLSLLCGFTGFGIIILFHSQLSVIMNLPVTLLYCLGLQCLLYNPYGCWISRTKYEYNYLSLVKITLLVSLLSPMLSVLFICVSVDKAIGKVWGQNLIYLILGLALLLGSIRKDKRLYNKEFWTYALKFNIPLIPHYLSLIILNQSDRVMITSICGASDNGLYSVAYSAASLLLILNAGVTQSLTPWIYKNLKNRNTENIKKYTTVVCVIYMVITISFIAVAPEAIFILAGKKYKAAVYVIAPVAASMYLIFLYNLYSIIEFYHEKTKSVMVCSSISALLNIILNYIYIPRYGYLAAAYTTLCCYLVNVLMHVIVIRSIYYNKTNEDQVIDVRKTIEVGVGLIVTSFFLTALFPYIIIRIIIVALMIIAAFTKRQFIWKFLKDIRKF